MSEKKKALIAGVVIMAVLLIGIFYLSYLGLREDPDQVDELKENADEYLDDKYNENIEIVDTLNDNTGVFGVFRYAAIAEEEDGFRFLIYRHNKTKNYQDSYVAEKWGNELEDFLEPKIEELYGEDTLKELWLTYPKDIGYQLQIDHTDVPTVKGQDAKPIIRVTLNRGEIDEDEQLLDELITSMENELEVPGGHISINYSDSALIFKDESLKKDF
ncbi:hypothetical protein CEY16_01405 [Halalkalibacillus sediminis]|uniref:Uncharacterized protein n=1 Tax=Halalkalibacillus sediminis TaxID=2018042 RepID=A0A2I0QVS9_9BACI|nr:hypothetical protein [Halalkalibacillus sediminis]PKR78442.1 hypothetical protein CEY16_01405 [Halalkalibacillus sediminis]